MLKNKHVRYEFLDRKRIINNLTQRVWIEFPLKGYHAYIMNWNLPFGEFLKARFESENEFHKSAVAVKKSILWLDIYQKEKLINSQKLFCFFFVEAIKTFAFEVTGKRANLGDREGLQIPCKLHFTWYAKHIDKLKHILPILLEIYLFYFIFPYFLMINGRKFELTSIFFKLLKLVNFQIIVVRSKWHKT